MMFLLVFILLELVNGFVSVFLIIFDAKQYDIYSYLSYMKTVEMIVIAVLLLLVFAVILAKEKGKQYLYMNKYYLKYKDFIFDRRILISILVIFAFLFFKPIVVMSIEKIYFNDIYINKLKISYFVLFFMSFFILLVLIILYMRIKQTEKQLLIKKTKSTNILLGGQTLIIYDLCLENYQKIVSNLSCIEKEYIFINIDDYIDNNPKIKKDGFFKINGICLITDFKNKIQYTEDLSELHSYYIDISKKSNIYNVIVFDNESLSKEMIDNISHRKWIYTYKYKNSNNSYIDIYESTINVISGEEYKEISNDKYIRELRKQMFLLSKDAMLFNMKNYITYIGSILFYFGICKNNKESIATEDIGKLYTEIENNIDYVKNIMYKKVKLNFEESTIIEDFNNSKVIGYEFDNYKEINLNAILFAIKEIANKTIGHGQVTSNIIDNLYPIMKLLIVKFDEILKIDTLEIKDESDAISISYMGEEVVVNRIQNIEPIIIEKFFPSILVSKKRKFNNKEDIVRRNYFEGDEYTPRDVTLF